MERNIKMELYRQIQAFIPSNDQEANDQKIMLSHIKRFKDQVLTRENEVAHMTSSGLILNPSLDKMLMIHHNIYKTWAWTGGHCDGEVDLLKTALKEAKEETGIKQMKALSKEIASLDILPVYGHFKRGAYVSAHLHLNASYVLIANEDAQLTVNEEETSGVQWIQLAELELYSNEPYLIDVYRKIVNWAKSHEIQGSQY